MLREEIKHKDQFMKEQQELWMRDKVELVSEIENMAEAWRSAIDFHKEQASLIETERQVLCEHTELYENRVKAFYDQEEMGK